MAIPKRQFVLIEKSLYQFKNLVTKSLVFNQSVLMYEQPRQLCAETDQEAARVGIVKLHHLWISYETAAGKAFLVGAGQSICSKCKTGWFVGERR